MNNLKLLIFIIFILPNSILSQVGIGTTTPQGQLDVSSTNLGLVVPRVTSVEDVSDGNSNNAVNGTVVYDLSRQKMCFRIDDTWVCTGLDGMGGTDTEVITDPISIVSGYIKSSNTDSNDNFGYAVSLSSDGSRLAISANYEDSNATGINGDQSDDSASGSGAVYVFVNSGSAWSQEAYIKASNTNNTDLFGVSIHLNSDGSYLAVGAEREDSNAAGINGDQTNNSETDSGAVYVFKRTGTSWAQEAYIKASNTGSNEYFGKSVSLNSDASYLAVGAYRENSNATGINGDQTDNSATNAGAVYVFKRSGTTWTQEVYIKGSNTESEDNFGISVNLNSDASYLAVGANGEASNATGINGDESNNSKATSGAVYVFNRAGSTWTQEAYIKASNTDNDDFFGQSVSISSDASILVVGAYREASNAIGIDGDQTNNSATNAGAVYVFNRTGTIWSQQSYIKGSNTEAVDYFGYSVNISNDGTKFAVGAYREDSIAIGINGNESSNGASASGAVYLFKKSGSTWAQEAYIKASNTEANDLFGYSLSINSNGSGLAVGAYGEDSNATGIGGDQTNNSSGASGAVYIIE